MTNEARDFLFAYKYADLQCEIHDLIKRYGMASVLYYMISELKVIGNNPPPMPDYISRLIDDLETTLSNYQGRNDNVAE